MQKKERRARLERLQGEERTMILYEAPHKLRDTLADLLEAFGPERRISLCRELTKLHEQVLRLSLGEAAAHYAENEPRGEYVLVLEGAAPRDDAVTPEQALALCRALIADGMRKKDAAKEASRQTGLSAKELYAALVAEES